MPPGRAGFGAAAGAGGVDRARTDRAGPGPVGLQIPPGVGGRRAAVGRLGGVGRMSWWTELRGGGMGDMGRSGVRRRRGERREGGCSESYN